LTLLAGIGRIGGITGRSTTGFDRDGFAELPLTVAHARRLTSLALLHRGDIYDSWFATGSR
jgi:hypothetical protein